ncbi:MAG: hypothetical protein SGARI_001225, partial [Bacillariaceae sp.]
MFSFKKKRTETVAASSSPKSSWRPSHRGTNVNTNAEEAATEEIPQFPSMHKITVVSNSQSDMSGETGPSRQKRHDRNLSLTSLSEATSHDESRDDATEAYTYVSGGDTDTYASSYISRDDSRLTTYTDFDDTYTRGSFSAAPSTGIQQLERLDEDSLEDEEEEDDDHDDMTLFSTETDYRTLMTYEERDFARFVQNQQMTEANGGAAKTVAATDAANSNSATSRQPSSRGICANFLDICGFLAAEMKDDPEDEPATKERSNTSFEEELDEDDRVYESDEEEDRDDETLLDVYRDDASAMLTPTEEPHSSGNLGDATEKHTNEFENVFDPATESANAAAIESPSKHKRSWNKIGKSLRHSAKAIIPRKSKQPQESTEGLQATEDNSSNIEQVQPSPKARSLRNIIPRKNKQHQESTEDSQATEDSPSNIEQVQPSPKARSLRNIIPRKNKTEEAKDISCPTDEQMSPEEELAQQSPKSKSKRRASKMLKGLKKVQTGSQKFVQAAVMTAMTQSAVGKVQTIDSIATTKSRDLIAPDHPAVGTSTDELQAIPLAHTASLGGRSITKEKFQQVIAKDEGQVKTVKKVKVGVDENGNDKFAFLVFMSDGADDLDSEEINDSNTGVEDPKPVNQLVRGKMDDDQMELTRARTESAEAMCADVNGAQEDCPIILMEVDEMPRRLTDTEEVPRETPSDASNPIAAFRPTLPTEKTSQDEQKSFSVLDALSFESTGHESNPDMENREIPDGTTKGSVDSTAVTPHELVLMEVGDEDEIEIELEEEVDDETTQTGDQSFSGHLPMFPVSSDCAVAAFSVENESVAEEAAASTAD